MVVILAAILDFNKNWKCQVKTARNDSSLSPLAAQCRFSDLLATRLQTLAFIHFTEVGKVWARIDQIFCSHTLFTVSYVVVCAADETNLRLSPSAKQ
ncbi:unnamed protein product [Porites evermanni]|uniref:Uncharacterized protein n=1 Tax=Porites evermanni TaxID=104178 RepID=A0ABN8MGS7_9CNID|nr:unnamed protein product [Porites evermanni]